LYEKESIKIITFFFVTNLFLSASPHISATVYQKEVSLNQNLEQHKSFTSEKKKQPKKGFIKNWIEKKLIKRLLKSEFNEEQSSHQLSLFSVIFGGVSLLMLLFVTSTPFTALLAALLGVASFVLGIVGLITEKSSVLSGLGILLGGIVTIFLLIGIINTL
jgi:VIT1/CCC1 family predicted Fe2+/Mn2+ transporter